MLAIQIKNILIFIEYFPLNCLQIYLEVINLPLKRALAK